MSILTWLKRLTRRRMDDDDLQDETRAHLKIAADERIADGADRQSAVSGNYFQLLGVRAQIGRHAAAVG